MMQLMANSILKDIFVLNIIKCLLLLCAILFHTIITIRQETGQQELQIKASN